MPEISTATPRRTDKRSSRTRKALAEALFALLEKREFQKITVNDICFVAEVSRPTFYTYFDDKYVLLQFCIERFYAEVVENAEAKGGSNRDIITATFDCLEKYQKTFRNLLLGETNRELSDIISNSFYQLNYDALAMLEGKGHVHNIPKELTSAFRAGGSVLVMSWWVSGGFKIPKDHMIEYMLYLNGSVESIITHP